MTLKPRVLLSLSLAEDEKNLLRYAIDFCEKAQFDLEICHVIERQSVYTCEASHFPETLMVTEVEDSVEAEANRKLESLVSSFNTKVIRSYYTRSGWVETSIIDLLKDRNFQLIISGKDANYRPLFKRMSSNLLGLSKVADIPILAVPKDFSRSLPDNPKILLADSLCSKTRRALNAAFDLAFSLTKTSIHHLYVCDEVNKNLNRVEPAVLDKIFAVLHEHSGDSKYFKLILSEYLKDAMRERCKDRINLNAVGGGYQTLLRFGRVSKELNACIQQLDCDILVVGGHFKSILQTIVYRNQLTFEEQTSNDIPVLMVPQDTQEENWYSMAA